MYGLITQFNDNFQINTIYTISTTHKAFWQFLSENGCDSFNIQRMLQKNFEKTIVEQLKMDVSLDEMVS